MDTTLDTLILAIGPRDHDRLDQLAETVLQVAKPTGATVLLSHVFTGEQFQEIAAELDYPKATAEDVDAILNRHESVSHLTSLFDEHGVAHQVHGFVGNSSEKIVTLAAETDADRVVVSGRARSPVGKAVFGSTAQRILLEAPCPVTYVKPAERES